MSNRCCHLLNRVGRDRTVWHTADFRSKPMPIDELRLCLKYLHPTTSSISINGKINNNNELYELKRYFLNTVCKLCTSLKELVIEEYKIISTEVIEIYLNFSSYYLLNIYFIFTDKN